MSYLQRSYKSMPFIIVGGILLGYMIMLISGRPASQAYIIQGDDLNSLKAAVQAVGGEVTHELGIINAAGVKLSDAKLRALNDRAEVRQVYADAAVEVTGKPIKNAEEPGTGEVIETYYPTQLL